MLQIKEGQTDNQPGPDALSSYRKRIWGMFGIVFVAIFLPGSIFIMYNGFTMLSLAVMATAGVFGLIRYTSLSTRVPQLSMAVFMMALMLVTGLSLLQRGIFGVFWAFPAILMINFLATRRPARIYTGIFVAYIGAISFYVLDTPIAARALTGLIVTTLLTNSFLGIVAELQAKLVKQSNIDPLTGALNRRQIDPILEEAIERKRRTSTPASLLVLDVDKFKSVNDNFGHAVGDRVLKELVSLIGNRARRLDKLFRMGGEEFLLFLPDTEGAGAVRLAEDLRICVSEADFIKDHSITISIGISELEHGETIDEWIKRGDDALFRAKRDGRNRSVQDSFVLPAGTIGVNAMMKDAQGLA